MESIHPANALRGELMIIGGKEDKDGNSVILRRAVKMMTERKVRGHGMRAEPSPIEPSASEPSESEPRESEPRESEPRESEHNASESGAARTANAGRVMVLTVASLTAHEELGQIYTETFQRLGVKDVEVLELRTRDEAFDQEVIQKAGEASMFFFTGGDQLRITSFLGGTPLLDKILERFQDGALYVGTSAGAAVVSDAMLIGGPSNASNMRAVRMGPGLGLLKGVVVDTHFAERGRFGRILSVIAENPNSLGIGLDEDTALYMDPSGQCEVVGTGAVYVFDGMSIAYSNLTDDDPERVVTLHGVTLHVLGPGARYDLAARRPM